MQLTVLIFCKVAQFDVGSNIYHDYRTRQVEMYKIAALALTLNKLGYRGQFI